MKLVPKYQKGDLVARQDNTSVVKSPTFKSIEIPYTPTQSYVSQDNRSKWQREQDGKKADMAYKQYMEDKKTQEGLHNLEGFLNLIDYAGLALGGAGLIGKGFGYIGKKLVKKGANKMIRNRFASSSLRSSKSASVTGEDELRKLLPDYAKPNWQGDGLELTKQRLRDGGFDRLENVKGNKKHYTSLQKLQDNYGFDPRDLDSSFDDFSPEGRRKLLEMLPRKGKASDFNSVPEEVGIADRKERYFTSSYDDAPKEYKTPYAKNNTEAHEFSHLAFYPNQSPTDGAFDFINSGLPNNTINYLTGINTKGALSSELTARGTQVKNYFGLKEGESITEDMLKYVARNYIKDTGVDNNMGDFFKAIKDYKTTAEWLTKFSPVLSAPLIYNKNDNK